jgi:Type IV secretion system pilin
MGLYLISIAITPLAASACTTLDLSAPFTPGGGSISCTDHGGLIMNYLILLIQYISGLVALYVVLMIVIGGVQYISSAGNPGAISAAKNRITNAIIALVLFLMMFTIMNFIVPGGILN